MSAECEHVKQSLRVDGTDLEVSALHRTGDKPAILFLHGFGSTKEDYADICRHQVFEGHSVLRPRFVIFPFIFSSLFFVVGFPRDCML